jgi:enterochelin esterase-like enzyme
MALSLVRALSPLAPVSLTALLLVAACTVEAPPSQNPPLTGGSTGQSGAATTSGSGGVPAAAGSSTAGSASAGAPGGMGGGGSGGAAAGQAGAAGSGGGTPGCEQAGTPGKSGQQCDPGIEGNGTQTQPVPASGTPPEAMGEPAGMTEGPKQFQSTLYGYSFQYSIYAPPGYTKGKPAALMIFQDAGNYLVNFKARKVFDALIAEGTMPMTIGLFIEPGQQRSEEYDTRDDKYAKMLLTEMIPGVVAPNYDLVDDPNGWAIGGHSSGGACAFNAGWWFPDKFRKIMTHNGSFVDLQEPSNADYIDMVVAEPKKPLRVTMLSGTKDLGGDRWYNANNDMAASFETAGYAYRYLKSDTTHDPNPYSTSDFPNALRWLWRGYTLPHYE